MLQSELPGCTSCGSECLRRGSRQADESPCQVTGVMCRSPARSGGQHLVQDIGLDRYDDRHSVGERLQDTRRMALGPGRMEKYIGSCVGLGFCVSSDRPLHTHNIPQGMPGHLIPQVRLRLSTTWADDSHSRLALPKFPLTSCCSFEKNIQPFNLNLQATEEQKLACVTTSRGGQLFFGRRPDTISRDNDRTSPVARPLIFALREILDSARTRDKGIEEQASAEPLLPGLMGQCLACHSPMWTHNIRYEATPELSRQPRMKRHERAVKHNKVRHEQPGPDTFPYRTPTGQMNHIPAQQHRQGQLRNGPGINAAHEQSDLDLRKLRLGQRQIGDGFSNPVGVLPAKGGNMEDLHGREHRKDDWCRTRSSISATEISVDNFRATLLEPANLARAPSVAAALLGRETFPPAYPM